MPVVLQNFPDAAADSAPSYGVAPSYGAAAAPDDSKPVIPNRYLSKADHLHMAAEHLRQAGRDEEAQRVRMMEAEEYAHGENAFILIELHMLEFRPEKLAKLSAERYGGSKGKTVLDLLTKLQLTGGTDTCLTSPDPKLLSLIDALRKEKLIIPRAEPNLHVVPDRSASMFVGGEIGYQVKKADGSETVKYKEYGTRAEVLATMMPDNRIHLDAHLSVSEPEPAKPERTATGFLSSLIGPGECTVPSINSRESECGVNLRSGQTCIVGGLVEMRTFDRVSEKVESFVMLRATLATTESPKAAGDKPGSTAKRSDGSARR